MEFQLVHDQLLKKNFCIFFLFVLIIGVPRNLYEQIGEFVWAASTIMLFREYYGAKHAAHE